MMKSQGMINSYWTMMMIFVFSSLFHVSSFQSDSISYRRRTTTTTTIIVDNTARNNSIRLSSSLSILLQQSQHRRYVNVQRLFSEINDKNTNENNTNSNNNNKNTEINYYSDFPPLPDDTDKQMIYTNEDWNDDDITTSSNKATSKKPIKTTKSVDWDEEWKKVVQKEQQGSSNSNIGSLFSNLSGTSGSKSSIKNQKSRPGKDYYKSDVEIAAIRAANKVTDKATKLLSSVPTSYDSIKYDWKLWVSVLAIISIGIALVQGSSYNSNMINTNSMDYMTPETTITIPTTPTSPTNSYFI